MQSKKYLEKIIPDGVFRKRPILFGGLLYDRREVSAAAVLHKNMKNSTLSINKAIVISYYMFVVKVFKDISGEGGNEILAAGSNGWAYTSDTICFLSLSLILSKFNSFRAKIYG